MGLEAVWNLRPLLRTARPAARCSARGALFADLPGITGFLTVTYAQWVSGTSFRQVSQVNASGHMHGRHGRHDATDSKNASPLKPSSSMSAGHTAPAHDRLQLTTAEPDHGDASLPRSSHGASEVTLLVTCMMNKRLSDALKALGTLALTTACLCRMPANCNGRCDDLLTPIEPGLGTQRQPMDASWIYPHWHHQRTAHCRHALGRILTLVT